MWPDSWWCFRGLKTSLLFRSVLLLAALKVGPRRNEQLSLSLCTVNQSSGPVSCVRQSCFRCGEPRTNGIGCVPTVPGQRGRSCCRSRFWAGLLCTCKVLNCSVSGILFRQLFSSGSSRRAAPPPSSGGGGVWRAGGAGARGPGYSWTNRRCDDSRRRLAGLSQPPQSLCADGHVQNMSKAANCYQGPLAALFRNV